MSEGRDGPEKLGSARREVRTQRGDGHVKWHSQVKEVALPGKQWIAAT